MIVHLKDRTQVIVTTEEADKIKQALDNGAVSIELGDRWFRADWIASIMPGGAVEKPIELRIEAPDNRGEYSPAKEKLRKDLEKLRNKVTV